MLRSAYLTTPFLILGFLNAAPTPDADLERQFTETVQPFLASYCAGCHSGAKPAASFDVKPYSTIASVVRDYPQWDAVQGKLSAFQMPPKGMKQPPEDVRQRVIAWIGDVKKNEVRKSAGDPGVVLARRLSNSEYNYTIRDLTGVDLRPAREFPVDPANQAGFDNSGESLTMSSALMAKYLQAAREVANHLVLKPDGFTFASHPMLVETDRDKYAIQRIVDFYTRQPTDFADYFQAAWRYKHRAALGQPKATLASIAAQSNISPKYLPTVWQILEETKEEVGPLVKLQSMWRELPAPKANQPDAPREGCNQMRDFVVKIRKHTAKLANSPSAPGLNVNSQPFVYWRNAQIAKQHRDFDPNALRVEGEPPAPELVVTTGPPFGSGEVIELKATIAQYKKDRLEDPDLAVPAGQRARYEAAFAKFSSVFPDAFAIKERGRFYPIESMDKGRYLSGGLHSSNSYFRDDSPLIELIIDEKEKKELEKLWEEFEFIADFTVRTYVQFAFNTGRQNQMNADGDRPAFDTITTEPVMQRTRDQYLARVAAANNTTATAAIQEHFERANKAIRWVEKARVDAEPHHLDALLKFAARAYRRPLDQSERNEILSYYRELREKSKLTHEDAMRASLISLLISPDFCYRVDLSDASVSSLGKPR